MSKIIIDGTAYKVTESLGFQGGVLAKFVETPYGEQVAVKRGGKWTWWTVQDRLGHNSSLSQVRR